MIDKDYSDPYEGYRGGVNRLEQKPLPKHNDMDMGVLAYMAPQNREQTIKPKTGAARGRLEAYHTQQRLDKGIGLGDYEKVPEHLKNIGVSKDRMKPRPSEKVMKMLVPEAQEGEYDAGGPSRARGEYHGSANRDNIEVGSVNGMVAKSEAQFDGIFGESSRAREREHRRNPASSLKTASSSPKTKLRTTASSRNPRMESAPPKNSTRTTRRARPSVLARAA